MSCLNFSIYGVTCPSDSRLDKLLALYVKAIFTIKITARVHTWLDMTLCR